MPKVRKPSTSVIEFEVSPWQTKKRKHDEVQEENFAARPVSIQESRLDPDKVPSIHELQPQHASQRAEPQQSARTCQNRGEHDNPEDQQFARQSADINPSLGILSLLDNESEVSPALRVAMQQILQQAQDPDCAASRSESLQAPNKLEGTACLAWLPGGQVIGDLHSLNGKRALSIRGREVVSERECTRDAEWKLLHVTLQQSSSCHEVSFLVEKTGCDAATLSAPFQLHGSEAGLLGEVTLQSDPSIHLSFSCDELLSDEAAEGQLAPRRPELRGQGAILNMGSFTCSGIGLELLDQPRRAQHELYDSDLDA